ncbi:MAG: hypothetical protein JW395_2346 [Nitrospira sp.]|nr:hypothetical protein [Nitrospira sp.]
MSDYPEDDEVYTRDTAPKRDSTFDPRTLGCRCDECPLGAKHRADMTWAPVPPDHRTVEGPCGKLTMIGDFPAADEVILRRPQVGVSGQLLVGALRASRVQRQEVSLSNMILCRPPASDLDRFRIELKRKWKRDVRVWKKGGSVGPQPLEPLDPVEACRPHLEAMILESDRIVSLGVGPSKWMLNRNKGINSIRGGFYEVAVWRDAQEHFQREVLGSDNQFLRQHKVIQVVPTISPATALDPTWARVLHRDIQRAVRWATNRLDWKDPSLLTIYPTVEDIRSFLKRPGPFECDIETTRHGPLLSVNRCIGIYDSTADLGITIPWESLDGITGLYPGQSSYTGFRARDNPGGAYERGHYTEQDGLEIIQLLKAWLLSTVPKVGHNFLLFDLSILERDLGLLDDPAYLTAEDPIYIVDSIFLARWEDAELPRTL